MKKNSTLTIRIDEDLKNRFITVAKSNDTDSNKEIRKFIKEYLAKYAQQKMEFA